MEPRRDSRGFATRVRKLDGNLHTVTFPSTYRTAICGITPTFCDWECAKSTILFNGSICESFQRPESSGVIRPFAATPVASTMANPGPRDTMPPKCAKCQSVRCPSGDEYWHNGESYAVQGQRPATSPQIFYYNNAQTIWRHHLQKCDSETRPLEF